MGEANTEKQTQKKGDLKPTEKQTLRIRGKGGD